MVKNEKYSFFKKTYIEKDDIYDFEESKEQSSQSSESLVQRTKKERYVFGTNAKKFIIPSGIEYYETKKGDDLTNALGDVNINPTNEMSKKSLLQPFNLSKPVKHFYEETGFVTTIKDKNTIYCEEKIRTMHEKGVFKRMKDAGQFLEDTSEDGRDQKIIEARTAPQKDMVVQSKPKDLAPKRMCNKSNNCFFNSTMQVILSFSDFVSFYRYNNGLKGKISIAFKNFIGKYEDDAVVDSDSFIRSLKSFIPILDGNEQDAHEFLVYFLNLLYCELGGSRKALGDEESFEAAKAENFIAKVFFGMQKNITKCEYCEEESVRYEEFINLTLPLNDTIRQSYNNYLEPEYLNAYICTKCKGQRQCSKRMEICKLPSILILHLRRFSGNKSKNANKIAIEAVVHIEDQKYKLVGLIEHHGVLNNGHYISEAVRGGHWWHFDDTSVYKLESIDLCKSDAYILFYRLI